METMMAQPKGAHSIQEAMRLGKSEDIYYYSSDTLTKQSIPSVVDNRFYQALTSLGAGSSTFIISIDQGISDIICSVKLPVGTVGGAVDYTGLGLPRGWVYALINRVSVRYGSSSQYFWTGQQMNIENLREMPNPTTRDNLYELGGAAVTTLGDFSGDNLYAYAYINLPHNSPNGSLGKPNPFPSELIGQPIVVTLELNPLQSIFSSSLALGDISGAPLALESAYFQVRQIHAKDAGELMTMPGGAGAAYSFPTKAFYQNEVTVQMSGAVQQQILLTGFRNGEVRSIFFWITKDSDTNPSTVAPFVRNYNNFILPADVELLYNGQVFYRAFDKASQMWALCTTETPPQLQAVSLTILAPGANLTKVPSVANWTEIPFSQVFEQLSGSHMYVAGKLIQNAVVNLSLKLPDTAAYTGHFVYSYNCAIMIANRGAEYAF
jgi:hypothetical protein